MARITQAQIRNPAALQRILVAMFDDLTAVHAGVTDLTAHLNTDGSVAAVNFDADDPAALTTTIPGAAAVVGQGGNPSSDPSFH